MIAWAKEVWIILIEEFTHQILVNIGKAQAWGLRNLDKAFVESADSAIQK